MSRPEILEKLDRFLTRNDVFTEESHVMYFLMECRKLMARDNKKYPCIKFYGDWSVHTEKSKSLDHMIPTMNNIFKEVTEKICSNIKNGEIESLHTENLRKEISQFLNDYRLPNSLTSSNESWYEFVKLLVGILADQPILSAKHEIAQFRYFTIAAGVIRGVIELQNEIKGEKYYEFASKVTTL